MKRAHQPSPKSSAKTPKAKSGEKGREQMSVTSVAPCLQVSPASIPVHGPGGPGARSPVQFMRFGLPSLFGKKKYSALEDDSDASPADHAASQRAAVAGLKASGRQAHAQAASLGSTRMGDVGGEVASIGFDAAMMGADLVAPGAGMAGGAAKSAYDMRREKKSGGSGRGTAGDEAINQGISNIPVVGQFATMARSVGKIGSTMAESAKARTTRKVGGADAVLARQEREAAGIASAREGLQHAGSDRERATQARQIAKAESRLNFGAQGAQDYKDKKSAKGRLGLLGGFE
jgi:hypothetical protein